MTVLWYDYSHQAYSTQISAFFHTVIRLICLFSRRDAEFTQRNILLPADNDNLGPAEITEMAEIFPLFRYFSVSSVIDKDNSQSDWRKEKHAAWPFCDFCDFCGK